MTVVNQKVDYTDKHHRLKWLNTIIGNIQTRDYSISSVKLRIFWYHIISKFTLDTLIIFWDYPLRPCSCTINRFAPMRVDKFIVSIFYESISLSLHIVSNQYIMFSKDVTTMKETKTLEFKETTETNSFLKTVSAFANYSDGKIIFGVCDDGTIKGIDHPEEACLNLENKINDSIKPIPFYTLEINDDNTITMEVKKGIYTPYFYRGKAYKRNDTATIEIDRLELNRLVLEGMNQTYEEQVSSKQDLSFLQLEKELSEKLGTDKITADILKTLGLMKHDKYNNAAALIADRNEYLGIDIVRFGKNINELMNRSMCDNISIFQMYHHAMEFYEMYYIYEKIEGSKRVRKELIPSQAYREALANALVHRLWDINSRIRISMFEDRIEISSPGGLPSDLDEEEYLNGQISNLRNPIIGNIFFRLDYIEMFGSGIKRIKAAYDDSLSKPEFTIFNNSIEVRLPVVESEITITDDEQAIIDALSTSQKLSRLQLEDKTGFSKSKAVRLLTSLNDKGMVLKSGSGPNIKYLRVKSSNRQIS